MIKNRIIVAAALASAIAAPAKDLKTEITVDRTIVPVEREAQRLGSLNPRLLSSPVTMRRLSLADYTEAAPMTRSASTLDPASYGDSFELSPYNGYASIGYFPVFNLGASAGYKFINTDRTRLGAWLQYDGCSYKPFDIEDAEGKYSNNTFTIGAGLDQRVGSKSSLSAHLSYMHSALGLPDFFTPTKQNVNACDIDLSWWSRVGLIGYHAKAAFSHFGYGKDLQFSAIPENTVKAAGENRFNFNAGIAFFGSSVVPRGGIEVAADFISRNNGNSMKIGLSDPDGEYFTSEPNIDNILGIVSLTPYYALYSGSVNARIGAKIDLSTGGEGKKFHIAPAVMLDWNAASQFAIYARFGGGEQQNSLRSLYDYCPFMPGYFVYQRSHVPFTADLGLNIGPFTGFSARIFGGYAIANDWLMPYYSEVSFGRYEKQMMTHFATNDLKGWHAGIGLTYEWRKTVKADVSAETASNDLDKAYYLWRDRAKYVINASVEVRPIEPLKIGVGYELRTDRHNYLLNRSGLTPVELKSISNLNFDAAYSFTPALTIFARGENLLNHHYNLAGDIQAQGLRGLIGAAYKF